MIKKYFITILVLLSTRLFGDNHSFIEPVKMEPDTFRFGQLTEESMPKFLEKAFSNKADKFQAFKSASCLSAKNIGGQGGYNTRQLFLVVSTCIEPKTSFIVKEAADGLGEAVKLHAVAEYPGMAEITLPKHQDGLPMVAVPIAYLSYNVDERDHYLLVMPEAPGKLLCDFIDETKNDPSKAANVRTAFYALGRQMANFQNRFAESVDSNEVLKKSISHGDLKCLNIFYDETKQQYTLIDNESMQRSLDNKVPRFIDNFRLLYGNLLTGEVGKPATILEGVDLKKWYPLTVKSFAEGYVDVFPVDKQAQALTELRKLIDPDPLHFMLPSWAQIKSLYIDPIFDELAAKYK